MELSELFDNIKDFFSDSLSFGFDKFKELFESLFSSVFSWLYTYVFSNLFDFIKNTGSSTFSFFYKKVSGDIFSFNFIFILLGVVLFFTFFKLIVNIIRG